MNSEYEGGDLEKVVVQCKCPKCGKKFKKKMFWTGKEGVLLRKYCKVHERSLRKQEQTYSIDFNSGEPEFSIYKEIETLTMTPLHPGQSLFFGGKKGK